MKQHYSAERYEAIYDKDGEAEYLEAISRKHVSVYRRKTTFAGDILEDDLGAVWNVKSEATNAKKALKAQSRETIENRNIRNAERKIEQLLNTNYSTGDLALYATFARQPRNWEEAHKAIDWYIRELRKIRKERGMSELTYLYIFESADKDGVPVHQHFHIFLNAGIDRNEVERIWREKYGRANTTSLYQDEYGLTGFGYYVLKAPRDVKNRRKWAGSRNLRMPDVTRSTKLPNGQRITKKLMLDILAGKKDVKRVFEEAYKGYVFLDAKPKYSDYASGVYLYVRMRKIPKRE